MTDASLIERLEKATEGSRELDARIYWLVNKRNAQICYWNAAIGKPYGLPDHYDSVPDGLGKRGVEISAPQFTTSIDAALTLVPEGWWTTHMSGGNPGIPERPFPSKWYWGLSCHATEKSSAMDANGEAPAPALALCIAALRARLPDRSE